MRWKVNRLQVVRAFFRWDNPYFWAVVLRVGLLALMKPHPRGDAGDFEVIAHNLAAGHGFSRCWVPPFPPTSQRPPLYPIILSILYTFEISDVYGPGLLNMVFDLLAMKTSEKLGRVMGLSRPQVFPWILALCPMLITMGNYPLTESLSVLLFFLASLYFFEGRTARSGFTFGLLALCRSYYLLFPALLAGLHAVGRPIRKIPTKALILGVALSLAAPSVWVTRNLITLKRPLFSQTATAGQQAYYGLCRLGFDWWDPEDLQHVMTTRPFKDIISGQCLTDDQLLSLNTEAWQKVSECVQTHPGETVVNVLAKTWSLFFEWGQIFPYDYVPKGPRTIIDIIMMLIWARMIWIWSSYLRRHPLDSNMRYVLVNIGYVLVITLPFGIDARYLLAPGLLALGVTLQLLPRSIDFVQDPLLRIFGNPES
jgi:hypothetical protein